MQKQHYSTPAKIFLARHCESEFNAQNRVAGQLDPALSPKGQQQAHDLARLLGNEPLSAIYASSLTRAVQTAGPTATARGLQVFTREALMEMHMGILQGRFRDERDPEAQRISEERKQSKEQYRIPGGETLLELTRRVLPCLNGIVECETGNTILIVGHRRTNAVVLAALMGWLPEVAARLDLRQKYLYEIAPGVEPRLATIRLDGIKLGARYEGFRE